MHDREPPESGTDDQLYLIPEANDDDPDRSGSLEDLGPLAARIQEDLDVVRSLPQQLSRALGAIREVVSEIASAQEAIGDQIKGLREEQKEERAAIVGALQGELGDRLEAQTRTLQTGLGDRIEVQGESLRRSVGDVAGRLGELSERLEEPAEGEPGDRERLAAAVEGLRDRLVAGLTEGFRRVQEGVTGAIDRAGAEERASRDALPAEVAEQVAAGVVAEVKGLLTDSRPSWSGEEGLRALREVATAQQEMEKAARAMRAELDRVRKRIEAWGRARSSARLADEVGALEERVVELEGAIESRLAEEVAERLSRVFDRRFEALVQLIDARTTQPAPIEDEAERRGLFRRR